MTTDFTGPVQIKKEAVWEPRGKVNSTTTWEIDQPENIGEVFFLPAGEKMDVSEDKAFHIRGKDKWYLSQFFAPGQMVGPVIYSETKVGTPKEALLKCKPDALICIFLNSLAAVSAIAFILYLCDKRLGIFDLSPPFVLVFTFLSFLSFLAFGMFSHYRNINVRERTIAILNKEKRYEEKRGAGKSYITCGEINIDKLLVINT